MGLARNPGGELDLSWVLDAAVDAAEVAALDEQLPRRTPAGADLLLRLIGFLDLTTLSSDDTPARVRALCAKAMDPLGPQLRSRLRLDGAPPGVAAVCVFPAFLDVAGEALRGSGLPVAVVAGGFPHGLSPLRQRIAEVRECAERGAGEIDVVINRSLVLTEAWEALFDEVRAFREASGEAHLKVILGTGDLPSLREVARAARLCMLAGADFIKTSTGKEAVNATFPAGAVMLREIRSYRQRTGREVGFKPAGGIRTADQGLQWMQLVREELGEEWLRAERFRIGASTLLDDVRTRLERLADG